MFTKSATSQFGTHSQLTLNANLEKWTSPSIRSFNSIEVQEGPQIENDSEVNSGYLTRARHTDGTRSPREILALDSARARARARDGGHGPRGFSRQ